MSIGVAGLRSLLIPKRVSARPSFSGYFPTEGVEFDADLDLENIVQLVRSRKVSRITAEPHALRSANFNAIGAIDGPTFKSDLAAVLASAESVTKRKFSVYRADSGRPSHLTIHGDDDGLVPVCYSVRAAAYVQLFSHVATLHLGGQSKSIPGFDIGNQFRRICLRLLADCFLDEGELVPAVACMAAARDGVLYDPFIHARPISVELTQIRWRVVQIPAFYYPLWYFAFAHELGHRADRALALKIWNYERTSEAAALRQLEDSARSMERQYRDYHTADVARGRTSAVDRGHLVEDFRRRMPLWVNDLRSEMLADHVAAKLIWEVCVDAGQREKKGRPDTIAFFSEVILSLAYLLASQVVAKALSFDGSHDSSEKAERAATFLRFTTYTGIRYGTLIDTMIASPDILDMPKLTKHDENKLRRALESISPMTAVLIQASVDAIDYVRTARSVTEPGLKALFDPWEPTTSILPDTIAFWDRVDELDLWETPELLKERFVEAKARRDQANFARRERKEDQYS